MHNHDLSIYVYGPNAHLQVRRSDFFDNDDLGYGYGAVVRAGNGGGEENFLEISNSNFVRNTAAGSGGAFYTWPDNHLQISNCSFRDNLAPFGGAIRFRGGTSERAKLTITLSHFFNNTASDGNAGAIYAGDMTHLRLERTALIDNRAYANAGAIKLAASSVASFVSLTFHNNVAEKGNGGAVDAFGSWLTFFSSNLTNNSALVDGGAVNAISDCDVDLRGATQMNGNRALEGRGGAISLLTSSLRSDEGMLTFAANTAKLGGAVSADEEAQVRIYAGCQTTIFELYWSDSPQSSLSEWAVVRRTGDTANQTSSPTSYPTPIPSATPTVTEQPTISHNPTSFPSYVPTQTPSSSPSPGPTPFPSYPPTALSPTPQPSDTPTVEPTLFPSHSSMATVTRPTSSFLDQRGEWMFLDPTPQTDTSVSFCLSPGEYELVGSEGASCYSGWEGGYIRVIDASGTELASLEFDANAGCTATVSFTIGVDKTLTKSAGPVLFVQNTAAGSDAGFCGRGCGGAVYVGTVSPTGCLTPT